MPVNSLWQQARDKVRRDLWRPGANGVPDATVDENLHVALLEIESERRWLFLETVRTSDPFSGAQINLPEDCGAIASLAIIRPDGRTRDILENEQFDRVRWLSQTTTGGWPSCYARSGVDIFLDNAAPVGSRFEIVYSAATPETVSVASASTYNTTMAKHFNPVCTLAASYTAASYLKNDAEAGRQMGAFQRMFDRMIEQDDIDRTDNQGSVIRGDTFYHDMAFGYE